MAFSPRRRPLDINDRWAINKSTDKEKYSHVLVVVYTPEKTMPQPVIQIS